MEACESLKNVKSIINELESSLLIAGDATHAYRDPAVLVVRGVFHIFMTLVETDSDGRFYWYVAHTTTRDLRSFSPIRKLTVKDRSYNFSSPGNVVFHDGKYKLCCQTYCCENGEKYGNGRSRLYIMESEDLENWSEPYLLNVKGDLPSEKAGRMIDPYLIYDENEELWNIFYKQNGVSRSVSKDLKHFEYRGFIEGGENVSLLREGNLYYMFHSPDNGIGVKLSEDLAKWRDLGEPLTFGQSEWSWAKGRLTAGAILKIADEKEPLYLMFFHGTGPEDESLIFETHACIGVAWSYDLKDWHWK